MVQVCLFARFSGKPSLFGGYILFMDSDSLRDIVIMAVLILMSAYFSATETAFSSLNKTRLKTRAEKGSRRASATLKLAEDYDKLLSTILIGNNIVKDRKSVV